MKDVNDRKMMILEAIIGLKEKVSADVSKVRVQSALQSRLDRQKWGQSQSQRQKTLINANIGNWT